MTELEMKILNKLGAKRECLKEYDAHCKAEYDRYMKEAEEQKDQYWKQEAIHKGERRLSFQKHGYDFLNKWKDVIADAMYGKDYYEFHSARAGRYGKGHGSYVTSELTDREIENVDEVFSRLVKRGYMKLSKTGVQATFKG